MDGNPPPSNTILGLIKKYRNVWLIPVLLFILLAAYLMFFSGSTAAPFIYSRF